MFAWILIGTPLGLTIVSNLGIVNPGFPGAEVATYGVNFHDFGGDWTGINTVHIAGQETGNIVSHGDSLGNWDHIFFSGTSPTSITVAHDNGGVLTSTNEQQLETDVESPIPLASYNYQNATPLNIGNGLAWDQGEELSFWNPTGIQSNTTTTLSNGTKVQSVTYTGTMENLLLIPGNFWLDISIPSAHSRSTTGSGWQEGSWSNLDFWYEIYWYNWLSGYAPLLEQDAGSPPASVMSYNARAQQFNNVGGFPIQGWIQQYQSLMDGYDISSII